jgi:cytochrome c-type biogenesis protein CcmH/NrfG
LARNALLSLINTDPNNSKALWFSAILAQRMGHYDQAYSFWNSLLKQIPPEQSAKRKELIEKIEEIKKTYPSSV